jgi:hypothetical protein
MKSLLTRKWLREVLPIRHVLSLEAPAHQAEVLLASGAIGWSTPGGPRGSKGAQVQSAGTVVLGFLSKRTPGGLLSL